MTEYKILTFCKVYDTLNYHQAAEQLGLSQPAVSQHIRALEQDFGCRLFFYDGKRLNPTREAEILLRYARAALFNERSLRRELASRPAPPVRIGATRTIGEFVMADGVCKYLRDPDRTLEITVENTRTLLGLLERQQLDFALIEGEFDKRRYGFRLFQKARFVGMCREDHPFAGKTVGLEAVLGQTVILREKGSGTRDIFERTLAENGFGVDSLKRVVCVNNFSLIGRMVQENLGITFVYAPVAGAFPGTRSFHLDCMAEEHAFHFVYLKGAEAEGMIRSVFPQESG